MINNTSTYSIPASINITDFAGVDPSGLTDCSAGFLSAVANGDDISIPPGSYLFSTNITTAKGKILRFSAGAVLKIAPNCTFKILGSIDAPKKYKIFEANGNAASGKVVGLSQVYPEWWGAKGDLVTDDIIALRCAHDCIINSSTRAEGEWPTIHLSDVYLISDTWTIVQNQPNGVSFRIKGGGIAATRICPSSIFPAGPVIKISGVDPTYVSVNWELTDLSIRPSPGVLDQRLPVCLLVVKTLILVQSSIWTECSSLVKNIYVTGFPVCLHLCEARLIKFERSSLWNNTIAVQNTPLLIEERGHFTGDLTFSDCQIVGSGSTTVSAVSIISQNGGSIAGIRFRDLIGYSSTGQSPSAESIHFWKFA